MDLLHCFLRWWPLSLNFNFRKEAGDEKKLFLTCCIFCTHNGAQQDPLQVSWFLFSRWSTRTVWPWRTNSWCKISECCKTQKSKHAPGGPTDLCGWTPIPQVWSGLKSSWCSFPAQDWGLWWNHGVLIQVVRRRLIGSDLEIAAAQEELKRSRWPSRRGVFHFYELGIAACISILPLSMCI